VLYGTEAFASSRARERGATRREPWRTVLSS
jgi:hypothetical protein